jgi:hypothetical protein
MRLIDQSPTIGRAIEGRRLPPRRSDRLKIAEHGSPRRARMRRLDQGIGEIAKLSFPVAQLELRRTQADASCRLRTDPAVHVIVAHIIAGTAEIAAAAASEHDAAAQQDQSR